MFRKRVSIALMAVLSIVSVKARAEFPALPGTAIGDDSIAVIHFNTAKFDPASVKASVKAILGAQAGVADEGIKKFSDKYDEVIKSGAQSMTMVVGSAAKKGDEPRMAAYIQMKPGSDAAAIQKAMTADMKDSEAADAVFEKSGNFLVMHKKGEDLPTKASDTQAKALAAAVTDAGDKAIVIAFAPTEGARAQLTAELAEKQDMPAPAAEAAAAFINAKWVTLSVTLGDAPALGIGVQASDDASATKLMDQINAGLKEALDKTKENPLFAMAVPLLDALKPTKAGSKITMGIDGKTIAPMAQMLAGFAGAAGPRPGPGQGNAPKHVPAPQ